MRSSCEILAKSAKMVLVLSFRMIFLSYWIRFLCDSKSVVVLNNYVLH